MIILVKYLLLGITFLISRQYFLSIAQFDTIRYFNGLSKRGIKDLTVGDLITSAILGKFTERKAVKFKFLLKLNPRLVTKWSALDNFKLFWNPVWGITRPHGFQLLIVCALLSSDNPDVKVACCAVASELLGCCCFWTSQAEEHKNRPGSCCRCWFLKEEQDWRTRKSEENQEQRGKEETLRKDLDE